MLPLIQAGLQVAVTLTPTAAEWLDHVGELDAITEATGIPVGSKPRLPGQPSPHPKIDVFVGAPLTANTTGKARPRDRRQPGADGVEREHRHRPAMILFPRINAAHARQPAWSDHIERLRSAGCQLAYGDDVWPLHEPRTAGPRDLPWEAILGMVLDSLSGIAAESLRMTTIGGSERWPTLGQV